MNIRQINDELPITDFLASQGIQPSYKRGVDWWYVSPIRAPERTPSFKVNTRLNRWYDHGPGEGGKLFDLALRLHPGATVREVIELLSGSSLPSPENVTPRLPQQPAHAQKPASLPAASPGLRILATTPLEAGNPLTTYLAQRGIPLATASPYCQAVHFSVGGREYQAVGFQNRSGGYELRNAWFKGSSSPKDVTFIDRGCGKLCVLEGFIDFLSLLQLRPRLVRQASFLVLNSLSQLGKCQEVLGRHRQALLFLDQDTAGRKVTARIQHTHVNTRDYSAFYRDHQDLNSYLVARGGQAAQLRLGLRHR
ncbi:toprim domain-containing protein [Pontibacter lucknowensis]|uniref:Toprim-like n=1 Tax=Pontibacter lucknowensis TaxID=1077936 RepID=A0A1N6Y1W8_9BACT|nr:toprim domain-containing protein [Pontibacter lucknowensis]SIR08578.1 Toprim-like [Pontibacter lucknowensis]